MMPKNDWTQLYEELSLTHSCQKYYMNMMLTFCDCSAETIQDFPTLSLVIDGIDYTIPPQTYVSPVTDDPGNTSCLLDVSYQNGWNMYILGLPLLENYYTVFDQ